MPVVHAWHEQLKVGHALQQAAVPAWRQGAKKKHDADDLH